MARALNFKVDLVMNNNVFKTLLLTLAAGFTLLFAVIVIPAFIQEPNILAAFGAGFVNPFSSGYSLDVFFCYAILALWIIYDAKAYSVKYGWLCLIVGAVPGVAVGFALYLFIRQQQVKEIKA